MHPSQLACFINLHQTPRHAWQGHQRCDCTEEANGSLERPDTSLDKPGQVELDNRPASPDNGDCPSLRLISPGSPTTLNFSNPPAPPNMPLSGLSNPFYSRRMSTPQHTPCPGCPSHPPVHRLVRAVQAVRLVQAILLEQFTTHSTPA
jgi:hypothetical protein